MITIKIRALFRQQQPVVSFEVFPPKPDSPVDTIVTTLNDLQRLTPDFISVTYGAGGSTAARTLEIASRIKNTLRIEALAHLTCVGCSHQDMTTTLAELRHAGIENILALRGDWPNDRPDFHLPDDYCYATDLIRHIHEQQYFCIAAACYPEGHLECRDNMLCLSHLQQKVNNGAEVLITQLFFDNHVFYSFLERVRKAGISTPICAGIMPVLNANQIRRITSLCGASIPSELQAIIARYSGKPQDMEQAGIEFACRQISGLLDYGVDGIHLYTMNKGTQATTIMHNTGLRR